MADDADGAAGSEADGTVEDDGASADGDGATVGNVESVGERAADDFADTGSEDGSGPDGGPEGECLLKRTETPEGTLVAVCDADVLGESFENGPVSLEVTEEFYGGDDAVRADADAVVEGLYDADTANLVGETCVGVAVDAGLIDEERVLDVGGTLHAQLLWL